MERYTVLTYIIGDYEKVHEIEEKSPNADYVLVTDNKNLTSETWDVVYDDDLDGLSTFDKCYEIRFNPFKYAKTNICLRIDGSIIVKKNLDPIILNFVIGQYDLGLMIHPLRNRLVDEYVTWVAHRNYPMECAKKCISTLSNIGLDKNYKGLYQFSWCLMRNDKTSNDLNNLSLSLLKCLGDEEKIERLDQTVVSFVINKFLNDKKILCVGEDLITNSSYFTWTLHGTDTPIPRKTNTVKPILFNKEVRLTDFETPLKPKSDKLSSFICTIQDVEEAQYDGSTNIIAMGDTQLSDGYELPIIHENTLDNISYLNKSVCEFTGMYWAWKNYPLKEFVMFNQYRIKLDVEGLDIEKTFQKHDVILPEHYNFTTTIANHYRYCHNIEDLNLLANAVKERYPEYSETVQKCFYKNNHFYSNNLFVMRREDFLRFCEFTYNILKDICNAYGITSYEDCVKRVEEHKKDYLKAMPNFPQNSSVEYQSRFLAYMIERLTNVFIMKNFKKPLEVHKIRHVKKYKNELTE